MANMAELIIKGKFMQDIRLTIKNYFEEVIYVVTTRVSTKQLIHNDNYFDWGQEVVTDGFPFAYLTNFLVSLQIVDRKVYFKSNDQIFSTFELRRDDPLESFYSLDVACATSKCMVLHYLEARNIPMNATYDIPAAITQRVSLASPNPAPTVSPDKHMFLFIGVMSDPFNFEKRQGARQSWMMDPNFESGKVYARFFMGKSKDPIVNEAVQLEAEKFQDIVFIDFFEDYYAITNKTLAIMKYASREVAPRYVMKCDDDTYVRLDRLIPLLENYQKEYLYLGSMTMKGKPIRDPRSKWYLSLEDFPYPTFPPFAHGPGYILTKNLADFISDQSSANQLKIFILEDVSLATWVDRAKNEFGMPVDILHNHNFLNGGCTANSITGHYLRPYQMRCMWQKVKRRELNYCCIA